MNKNNICSSKILIVEDNQVNGKVLSKVLSKHGYSCSIALNGAEAVERIVDEHEEYCLIIMDVQMPIMDGLKATKLIRENDSQIPIVALTANAAKEECLNAGMNNYLSKPFQTETVLQVLAEEIAKHS